jgi:hypothetical protein
LTPRSGRLRSTLDERQIVSRQSDKVVPNQAIAVVPNQTIILTSAFARRGSDPTSCPTVDMTLAVPGTEPVSVNPELPEDAVPFAGSGVATLSSTLSFALDDQPQVITIEGDADCWLTSRT